MLPKAYLFVPKNEDDRFSAANAGHAPFNEPIAVLNVSVRYRYRDSGDGGRHYRGRAA